MDQQHTLTLIDGAFTAGEAKSVLLAIVRSKIDFHSTESFGEFIRNGSKQTDHSKRLSELMKASDRVKEIVEYAAANDLSIALKSNIEICLLP